MNKHKVKAMEIVFKYGMHVPYCKADSMIQDITNALKIEYEAGMRDPCHYSTNIICNGSDKSRTFQAACEGCKPQLDADEVWLKMSTLYQLAWFAHSSEDNRDAYWDSFKHLHTALLTALGLE